MWRSVENRAKKKTDGTSKHGSPSSKANKGNCFVAVATEILGFVYDCGLTVGLTGVVYASEEASDVPPEDKSFHPAGLPSSTERLQPASSASSQGEPAAVQPVIGISQRVHTGPKKKKDLGPTGTVFHQYSSIIPTCISTLSHVHPVFFFERLRPRDPHDGDYHHPRSRHHNRILLQEVLFNTVPNIRENPHSVLVTQWGTFTSTLCEDAGDIILLR